MAEQRVPQAFPDAIAPGMTLRDYFAGQALTGVLTNAKGLNLMTTEARRVEFSAMAEYLFEFADAMLAAREAKP